MLTYGLSPYLVEHPGDEIYLKGLSSSLIYKDIKDIFSPKIYFYDVGIRNAF